METKPRGRNVCADGVKSITGSVKCVMEKIQRNTHSVPACTVLFHAMKRMPHGLTDVLDVKLLR